MAWHITHAHRLPVRFSRYPRRSDRRKTNAADRIIPSAERVPAKAQPGTWTATNNADDNALALQKPMYPSARRSTRPLKTHLLDERAQQARRAEGAEI